MRNERLPSNCSNSNFCEDYAKLEPLRRIGLPPKCPYLVQLTREIEVLGKKVPEGESVCIESMKSLIPEIS